MIHWRQAYQILKRHIRNIPKNSGINVVCKLTITNMAMVRHFEVMYDKFNPLKKKLVKIIFKNFDPTSQKTQPASITKINWFMLFGKRQLFILRIIQNP
jgi:hypothetical protein